MGEFLIFIPLTNFARWNPQRHFECAVPYAQVGAPYIRPGGVERPAGNNSIIIDAVLILPYAAFFSPVDAPFTTTQLKVSEGLSASLWASMGLDWQWTGSSVIVYGPPQFASILAKVKHPPWLPGFALG